MAGIFISNCSNWFQSTLPRGERPATSRRAQSGQLCFNPRSREGSDHRIRRLDPRSIWFQSTLPRGERLRRTIQDFEQELTFQSTLPRGERQRSVRRLSVSRVSIHAPARGATESAHDLVLSTAGFNPRSREGSDDLLA